jgi:regulation of enolase protein 1 (concanavalin A-like superfamily)
MKRFALLLTLFPLLAVAAPVPRDTQYIRGWGEPLDPLKDCKFDADNGKLTITIPGKGRDLRAHGHGIGNGKMDNGRMDAPRVLQEIEGDFTMEVTLEAEWPVGAARDLKEYVPCFCAGLFVAQDDKNFIRFEKTQYEHEGELTCYFYYQNWQNGESNSAPTGDSELDPKKPVKLRLQRKGDKFTAQASEDAGKIWKTLSFDNLKFAGKLQVGVAALHTTKSGFKPMFSEFKLEKPEAAKP